jgi:hypothetical protein
VPPLECSRPPAVAPSMQITDDQAKIIGREIGQAVGIHLKAAIHESLFVSGGRASLSERFLNDLRESIGKGFGRIADAVRSSK